MQRPGFPGAGDPGERSATGRLAQAEPPWLEYGPRTLSVVDTSWFPSGVTAPPRALGGGVGSWTGCRSFLPSFAQLRPNRDISNSERAGPVASEAMLTNRMTCRVATSALPVQFPPALTLSQTNTWAWGSPAPKTLAPLKSWRAR